MRRKFAIVALLALPLSGCALLKDFLSKSFQEPTLTFKDVRISELSLTGATLDLIYTVDNPNPTGISLAEVEYGLFIEGKQVVAGKPPQGLQIPASGRSDLVFPTSVKFADIAPIIQTFLSKDFAQYRAEGAIGLETPVGVVRFPLKKEGQFEVPKVPAFQLGTPRISNMTLWAATVELPITVTNRNSFSLPLGGLAGVINIANAPVATISTGELGALDAKGTRAINLPFTVKLFEVAAAANALRQGSAQVSFQGNLLSGGAKVPVSFAERLTFTR
jgi:LEA14-like dessication related protein